MKIAKLFVAAMSLAVVATACQEPMESVTPKGEGMEIAVSAQMYNFAKATDTAFEEGDQIGLHIVTNSVYLNNAKYTFSEGALVSESENYWYDDKSVEAKVLAYYPYNADATYKAEGYTFTVEADQSVEGGYAASDLLVASTTSKPTKETVTLPFKHALSKVVININSELDEAVESVMFADVYGSAVINLAYGTSTVNGQKGIIKAAKVANKESYTLIIVPQTEVKPRILVTVGEKQYNFNIEAAADFEAGKVATANITLTKELVGTDFSAEITDWVGDSELQFNPSEENTPDVGGDDNGENEGGNTEGGEPTTPEDPEDGKDPIVPEPDVFVPEATELGIVGSFASSAWATDEVLYTTPTEGLFVATNIEFAAYDSFKIRTVGVWDGVNIGRSANTVNYIQENKYIAVIENSEVEEAKNITVELAGTYDIYYNQNTSVVYVMVAGADIAEATEQTVSGNEPVVEEPEVTENVIYFAPNANWKADGARFAAYFFNAGSNVWVTLTDADADGIYECGLPVGYEFGDGVIFCRMNPATTANSWDNKWDQTEDLNIPTDGKNMFTVKEGEWNAATGTWSTK